jgi:hypothetical protein
MCGASGRPMPTSSDLRILALALALLGCAAPTENHAPRAPTAPLSAPPPNAAPAVAPSEPAEVAPPAEHALLVTDPAVLAALERDAAPFWKLFGARASASTAELSREPHFRALASLVRADVAKKERDDRQAGVGMKPAHRLFDPGWLSSPRLRFELVGVVNRLDRWPFAPEHCGETRLVYRLAYTTTVRGKSLTSRLPMTVAMVFWQAREGATCRGAAEQWPAPWQPELASLLAQGALAPERLGAAQLKSIELNYQLVRWPSTVRPDMAGHAEYVLRVLHVAGATLVPAPLENTPDVARLRADASLRRELLAWLRDAENLAAIDAGTVRVPERFLARQAVSISPHGLARRANRPFRSLFGPEDFGALDLSSRLVASTPAALLRRLDGMSCAGCHQSRSTAGFHLLGEERDARRVDALEVAISPHFAGDLPRRAHELEAALGASAAPLRALSDHEALPGQYGAHCALGSDAGFAAMRCAPGLSCIDSGDELGSCLPEPGAGHGGDPCERAVVRSAASPYDDAAVVSEQGCRSGGCFTNHGGFPHGMCAESCGRDRDGTRCGLVPITLDFSGCVAQNRPFTECVETMAERAALRACDAEHACRDDYVCARAIGEGGVCLPTYFLFQLRVDGHDGI